MNYWAKVAGWLYIGMNRSGWITWNENISEWTVQDERGEWEYRDEMMSVHDRLHWMSIKGWITLNEWIDKVKDELWDDCE